MSSSDSDEDFGPVIPPPLKRERAEGQSGEEREKDSTSAIHAAVDTCAKQQQASTEKEGTSSATATATVEVVTNGGNDRAAAEWSFYTQYSDLPCAPLFERAFVHDRANTNTNSGVAPSAPSSSSCVPLLPPTTARPSKVHDMAVLEDSLGAMVCSVDASGVVRVWRMLPSGGLFFLGEQDRIFPRTNRSGDTDDNKSKDSIDNSCSTGPPRSFYVCVNTLMQWLIVVCVTEEEQQQQSLTAQVSVHVDMRRVNPLTLTVEAKGECSFRVPSSGGGGSGGVFTRRSTLLQHKYEPHLAFFVGIASSSSAGNATTAAAVTSGVVLFPCFPPATAAAAIPLTSSSSSSFGGSGGSVGTGALRVYRATKLSTANIISCCTQHTRAPGGSSSGSSGGGLSSSSYSSSASSNNNATSASSPALVLVDEKGIVDYATIDSVSPEEEDNSSGGRSNNHADADDGFAAPPPTSGLTLRVIVGLSAAAQPQNAAAAAARRLWARWIRFDRRVSTSFFAVLRATMQHAEAAAGGGGGGDVWCETVPLGVSLSPSGQFFAVATLLVRATEVVVVEGERSRTSTTSSSSTAYRVLTRPELFVFDFPTGKCIGTCRGDGEAAATTEETLVLNRGPQSSTTGTQQSARELLTEHIAGVVRRSFAGIAIAESSAVRRPRDGAVCRGLYILVPVVRLTNSCSGGSGSSSNGAEAQQGRPIRVYQAAFPTMRTVKEGDNTSAVVEVSCLPREVGELEKVLTAAPEAAAVSVPVTAPVVVGSAAAAITAPLALLRRCVAPSQDLKNLVGRSPIGAALTAEELKKLVFTVGNRTELERARQQAEAKQEQEEKEEDDKGEGGGGGNALTKQQQARSGLSPHQYPVTDRIAMTTSMAGTALIAYVSTAATSSPATAHLSAVNRTANMMERLIASCEAVAINVSNVSSSSKDSSSSSSGGAGGEAAGTMTTATADTTDAAPGSRWTEVCRELRPMREFHCGRLLALSSKTIAGQQQLQQQLEEDDSGAASGHANAQWETATATAAVDAVSTSEASTTTTNKNNSTTAAILGAAPAAGMTPAQKEAAAVAQLLAPAMATLPTPTQQQQHQPTRAFLTVRGHGVIELHLLPAVAPLAVRSFTNLARRGYYSGLTFHRVIPRMMIQGGCPKGDGTGGASGLDGGEFPDENLDLFPFFSYTQSHLWLCMANAGPNTNGSQFFITVPEAGDPSSSSGSGGGLPWLNGLHTVVGFVANGKEVVAALSRVQRDEQDKPFRPLVIERVDVL